MVKYQQWNLSDFKLSKINNFMVKNQFNYKWASVRLIADFSTETSSRKAVG